MKKDKCPNIINIQTKEVCHYEFEIGEDGQPTSYRCHNCKGKRMYCRQCGTLIDEGWMNMNKCLNCGKNPHEEFPGPSTDRTSPFSIKINRP